MAYNRRYMRPFTGTTVVIQDDAITQDKIDEKAVTEGKLADDSVSERVIGTGAVDTDELKDGAVKTVDIGDGQVTEEKLADGAVTEDKLSFTPSTRPLSPGVSTAEIADDAVDKDKIGPEAVESAAIKGGAIIASKLDTDAVETSKIKDDAVTTDKIAASSVGHEEIKANGVRGTEIQDGAVDEAKIGTEAVTTAKIKALNVTEPKLEADILRKLLDDRQLFYDDFIGAALRSEWAASGDPGGSVSRAYSEANIWAPAVDDEMFRLNFGGDTTTSDRDLPTVYVRAKSIITFNHVRFGLYFDADNYILFDFDTDVDGNWHIKAKKLGAETDSTTNVAATATLQEFLFEVLSPTAIQFYIDGTPRGIISTNIPLTMLEPWLEVQNRSAAARRLTVDKFILSTNNSEGAPPP